MEQRANPTGRSFLHHDMTPVDPTEPSKRQSNYYYEPSTGEPLRQFGRKYHGVQASDGTPIMLDNPVRAQKEAEMRARPQVEPRRMRPGDDPGAARRPSDFLSGAHTTSAPKRAGEYGIKAMFDNPERLKERMSQAKTLDKAVSDANWMTAQQRREERRQTRESDTAPSRLANDPWEDRKPVVEVDQRRPRVNRVARGDVFQDGGDDAYVARAFGKEGGGAPRHAPDGQIISRKRNDFASYRAHNTGPPDSWVSQNFGKPGAGNPLRDEQGHPMTRLDGKVGKHLIHNQGNPSELQLGTVGPGGRPRQSTGGSLQVRRRGDIEHDRHHQQGPPDPFLDHNFGKSPPQQANPKRHNLDRGLAEQHNSGPPIYLDRNKDLLSKPYQKPARITQDEEFSGRFRPQYAGNGNTNMGSAVYHGK